MSPSAPCSEHALNRQQIQDWPVESTPRDRASALNHARESMRESECWSPAQQMGRRWPIGCVALEITQRCNLDCSLCYLSEHSEAVRDIPLEEIYRRIDLIHTHYGSGIDVQVTGGDPTLRNTQELILIIRRLRDQGQRPTLMTNGIKARRPLLKQLLEAGLCDVAFHVDMTQERKGYDSEEELNQLRLQYINNARGLGLSIMFNTTVHGGNFHEIPVLVEFFKQHADAVRTASFQLQADTGRGTQSGRAPTINNQTVWAQIECGLGTALNRNAIQVGHPQCSGYGMSLIANGNAINLYKNSNAIGKLQALTAHIPFQRNDRRATFHAFKDWLSQHPVQVFNALILAGQLLAPHWQPLLRCKGRLHSLSFITHNFMHDNALESQRIKACVFTTMTAKGPLSMCMHNAKRDTFILAPVKLSNGNFWQPLEGRERAQPVNISTLNLHDYGLKRSKGRARQALMEQRLVAARSPP
jgi:hypothetical protein